MMLMYMDPLGKVACSTTYHKYTAWATALCYCSFDLSGLGVGFLDTGSTII